ncbi:MAG: S41 family peptidase [Bacteroidia bacterium]
MRRRFKIIFISIAVGVVLSVGFKASDTYFEISKNLEIFASVFREINTYYVDGINPGKLTKKAIDEMLRTLDPYTNYISESEAEDFKFQMTGQYGGIGALIGQKGDYVVITEPYEGFPAHKADLMAGDLIIEVEGKSAKGKSTSDVSKLLKGAAGSQVTIKVKRNDTELTKTLTREEIKVKNVPYFGMIDNNTGYIKLTGFTNNAGAEVRDAVVELKKQNAQQIILDVRGNPGGLLHEAVNVVNVFVPQGQLVVSTKGKVSEWNKNYQTLNSAVELNLPIAVLTSRGSASASEIVSGTIQDLDRGIVVGQRTFGKGLVQNTRPLVYGTQLKVTTAKYYTPSGRCIQALDYSNRNEDGSVGAVPDSLKKAFKTKNGRTVYDGGGVEPDIVVELKPYSQIAQSLISKQLIFDYATKYRFKYATISNAKDFRLSEADFNDFKMFIAGKDYGYQTQTEKELEELKQKAEHEKYFDAIKNTYETMKKQLSHDKEQDIERNKEEIIRLLEEEIVKRYYLQKGRIEQSFKYDNDILKAIETLNNKQTYNNILFPQQAKK